MQTRILKKREELVRRDIRIRIRIRYVYVWWGERWVQEKGIERGWRGGCGAYACMGCQALSGLYAVLCCTLCYVLASLDCVLLCFALLALH
jgi:hypothetical protein